VPFDCLPVEGDSDRFRAMTPNRVRTTPTRILGALILLLAAAACGKSLGVFLLTVPLRPSEVTLNDFTTGALQDPSAFDVIGDQAVRVDQTNQWDFLFRVANGVGEFVPFSSLADSVTEAGLLKSMDAFDGVLKAPRDGYERNNAVPIALGDVIMVRSRRNRTQILICNQFLKLEVLDLDLVRRSVTFRYLRNPNCGDTVLEPGEHGSL